jgi:ABC-type dipeptide/oligopeptide/nickel transport system permease subunit
MAQTEPIAQQPALGAGARRERGDAEALTRADVRSTPGFYRRAWRRYRRDKIGMVALGVILLVVGFSLAAPLVSRYTGFTYTENHLADKLKAPGEGGYVLGSDGNGRDILTRLAYGGRVSLMVAALAAISTFLIGGTIGSVAGFFGGFLDGLLMRLVDVLLSIPTLSLLVLVGALYKPGPVLLAIVIAMVSWTGVARIVRGEVLALRHREYVEAARVVGSSNTRIITRHIFPNIVPIVIIWASLFIPALILIEAALSFLGLGVRPPTPSWGNMLQDARGFYRQAWTFVFIAGFMIYITVLALNLVGNALRDALDPRLSE